MTVSNADAWRLFDRSVSSGFTPNADLVRLELDRSETIVAIKVRAPSPYLLDVRGAGGTSLGFASINLSSLSAGWQTILTTSPTATNQVELRFRALGDVKAVPEVELWAEETQATTSRSVIFPSTSTTKSLEPGQCAEFAINVDRPSAIFGRVELAYESTGALRTFVLERSVNGRIPQGGTWLDGADSAPRSLREQLDPTQLAFGKNEVRLCAPRTATRSVEIDKLRIVGELDRGIDLAARASLSDGSDATALIDGKPDTSITVGANQRVVLNFDRLIAPDALVSDRDIAPRRVECIAKDGVATELDVEEVADALRLDGSDKTCRAVAVIFGSAITLSKLDVVGSGAEETVDWPYIVVTSAREHFGTRAWISGFVARPPTMTGAIRTQVAGLATEAKTGDFSRLIERSDVAGTWTVDVSASLPDGMQQTQKVVLAEDRVADLVANYAATALAAQVSDGRFGKVGMVSATQVSRTTATKVRLGTLVGIDVPAGAVAQRTTIKSKHLDADDLPPLDPGMINVTAPKGHGYEFLPHGQRFAKAVDVVIPFDAKLIPQAMSMNDVYTYYYDTRARRWKKLQRSAIDLGDHTTRSTTDHFTIMINAVLATPTNPKPLSFDPTTTSSVAAATPTANIDFVQPPVADATGDAKLSLPIRIPAGRGSYSPSLGLVYSSSASNGWLGVGWDLPISKIEIDTRWGVPTYGATEEPRYLIDGAEIIRTSDVEGPTCSNGKRYHLRVEGAFSHILRCGSDPSSYYWEVRDRNGTLYTYGGTTGSVLASYRSPFGVFRWNLREVTDVHGNKTTFVYVIDEIAAGPNGEEASRESYISSIDYSQHTSLTGKYRVDFVRDNGARTDRIISGRPGFKVVTRHLLRQIRVSLSDGAGLSTIRDYVLTYAQGQFGKAVLANVSVYGTGGCVPGLDAFEAPTSCAASFFHDHQFTYYGESDGLAGFGEPTTWTMVDDPNPPKGTILKGDSTTRSGSLSLGVSDGTSSASLGASGSSGERSEPIGLYDVNGDGLVDQVFEHLNWANGSEELLVLYNQHNNPAGNRTFSSAGPTVSGATRLGHERHRSWSVDAKVGINSKGFGASASGGYANAKSSADRITTDFDGDGFVDQISTNGTTLRSEPCQTGQCFTAATFDATNLISSQLDPALIQTEAEVSERLMLGDPVVQWIAPYDGTLTLVAHAQKRRDQGIDGVTIELWKRVVGVSPTQDALEAAVSIPADETAPYSLTLPNITAAAGQQFYMRIRTGDPDVDRTGQLNDELDAWMTADYSTVCSAGSCTTVPAVQPRDPTNSPIFSFSQVLDTRVNGTKPLHTRSAGTVRVRGQLIKSARSAAPMRFCLQRFGEPTQTSNGSFDVPCNSVDATNLSGTYTFTEAAITSYAIDVSASVAVGHLLVLRVESDYSIDPSVMRFVPFADQNPLAVYTEVCTPASGGQTSCSSDSGRVAQVPLELSTFGLFFSPVSPPFPTGAIPWATLASGTWQFRQFFNPLYPVPITVTIRSNTRGTRASFNCTSSCGHGSFPPTGPINVNLGESVTIEITATDVTSAPSWFVLPVLINGFEAELPVIFRKKTADPQARTPFVNARRGFYVTFWNENEEFQPSLLLEDYASLNTSMPPDATRLGEMMRSAIEPLPYSNNPPTYAATSPDPTWAAPGSVAFMTPSGHANAADVGVMQDNESGAASVFGGSYARLSCTRSYYIGVGITGSPSLHGVDLGSSLNGTVASSDTRTTTDVVDLNGDGIADVIAGNQRHLSTLVNGAVHSSGGLAIGDGFRRRTSQDYSFGFGGSASFPLTTSGGRRRSMGSQDTPKQTFGFSESEGFSVGRSQTTHDMADVNGDGLPDLVERSGTTIKVRYNLGARFDNWTAFGELDASLANTQIDSFQGFEDAEPVHGAFLLKTNENALSHESTITQNRTYSVDLYVASASYTTKTTSSRVTRQLADLNGDGLPDLLLKKAGEGFIRVQYNTGGTFAPATTWITPAWEGEVFPTFSTGSSYAGLFTGTHAVGGPDVLASTGTQDSTAFSGSISIPIYAKVSAGIGGSVAYEKDTYELGLVDVTGDGAADHVLRRGASNDPQYTYVKPNLANGKSNLMKKITGPLGGEISLEYELVLPSIDMPHARQTLSKVTIDDKSPAALEPAYSSPNLVTEYRYGGGYFDRLEKAFFGFRDVVTERADGQVVEQTFENRDFTLRGSLLQVSRKVSEGGALLHQQVFTRQVRSVVDANEVALVPNTVCLNGLHALLRRLGTAACTSKFAVVTKEEETRYEGAAHKTRTVEDLTFDRFGNVLSSFDGADDALTTDNLVSSVSYQNDTTRWILGRPTALEVHAGTSSGALLRSRRGLYNVNGQPYQLEVDTGTSPSIATTNLTYDAYGNLETLSTPVNEQGARQVYTLAYDPTLKTYVTSTSDSFGYQSQSTYDLRFGVATTATDINGASSVQTLDPFGRLVTVRGPYDTQAGDGVTLSYFHLENPPRATSVTKPTKPAGATGTPPPPVDVQTITNGFGEAIELRKTGVVDAVAGVITSGLSQRDNLGRVTRAFQPFFTPGTSTGFITPTSTPFVETQYDALDRMILTTYPDTATETNAYTIQATSTGTPLFRVQATNTDNHQRVTFVDHSGLTREFVEYPDATPVVTKYDYAATGELTQITDAQGFVSTLGYDLRGLRTSLRNPDTGLITDTFDAMGNRISTQEPNHRRNGVAVQFKYNLDRLERVIYPAKPAIRTCTGGATASVCYEYGAAGGDPLGRGRLVRVQDESGEQVHTYGQLGELRETVRTVAPPSTAPVVFDHRYVFDSVGHLLSLRYPDGETVLNTYDEAGNLKQVDGATFNRNYASDIRYDVFGNRTRLKYGNNVLSTWSYDYNRVRLAGVTTTLPGGRSIQALSYTYTNNNRGQNFASIANNIQAIVNTDATNTPGPSSLSFTYDGVDRLKTALGEAQLNASKSTSYDENFTYSSTHNVLTKQRVRREFQTGTTGYTYAPDHQIDRCSTPPCNAATYTYATNWDAACNGGDTGVRPHLPNQVGTSNFGVQLQYDCSGNPVVRQKADTGSTQLLTWDDDGRLTDTQEAGAQQHNTFDAGGTRVRRASSGGGQNNVTIYSSEYFDLNGNTQGARHVFAGSLRVATELSSFASSSSPPAPAAEGTRYFFHTDHLGSTTVITDQNTTAPAVYQSTEYYVDGDEWLDRAPQSATNQYLFNGKPFDKDTGFYDYGQRFYDARTSLWLGVDPALTDAPSAALGQPRMLAPFAYAAQNPIRFVDPDGRDVWDVIKWAAYDANPLVPANLIELGRGNVNRAVGITGQRFAMAAPYLGSYVRLGVASSTGLAKGMLVGSVLEGLATYTTTNSVSASANAVSWSLAGGIIGALGGKLAAATKSLDFGKGVDDGISAYAREVTRQTTLESVGEMRLVETQEFLPTHALTYSRRAMQALRADVAANGVREPILYVEHRGAKFVVDGHHRLAAAKGAGLKYIPARPVRLPHGAYQTTQSLEYSK